MGFKLDLTGDTAEALDLPQFAPPGVFWTELTDATEDNDSGAQVLEFTIKYGPCAGVKITEKLQNPEFATDETKAKNQAKKAKKWVNRLGAITKADEGKPDVEPDFIRCIGNEYILELESRSFAGKDGIEKKFTGCTYLGVWPLDHPDIPPAAVPALEAAAGKQLPPPRDGSERKRGDQAGGAAGKGAKRTPTKPGGGTATGSTSATAGPAAGAVDVAALGL